MSDGRVSAELAAIRERRANSMIGGLFRPTVAQLDLDADDLPRLLAVVEAVLAKHKIEPLYAHADDGECGCPVPADVVDFGHDAAYDAAHPEGYGPGGTGIVCSAKIVGRWCPGCADVAVAHGCFETPESYPPEKCDVRPDIERALTGEDGSE